jgi:hypothetical protein
MLSYLVLISSRGQQYLLMASMLQQLEAAGSLNIPTYAAYLARVCPPSDNLIASSTLSSSLTIDDYITAYEVLSEAVQSQGSVLRPADLRLDNLDLHLLSDLHMERQFCLATANPLLLRSAYKGTLKRGAQPWSALSAAAVINPFAALAALHPANQSKNNSLDFIAVDWSRIRLRSAATSSSTLRRASLASLTDPLSITTTNNTPDDYVNASWVPGYGGCQDFVISHHPGPGSLAQFWYMVYETRADIVVCLSIVPQPFWPLDPTAPPLRFSLSCESHSELAVWLESEGFTGGYRSACINLALIGQSASGSPVSPANDMRPSRTVQLIFCPNWPHQSIPVSNCVHLVDCVAKLAEASRLAAAAGDVGPVVVMDSFGATEAAIFCVLASLVKQMDLEVRISAKKKLPSI